MEPRNVTNPSPWFFTKSGSARQTARRTSPTGWECRVTGAQENGFTLVLLPPEPSIDTTSASGRSSVPSGMPCTVMGTFTAPSGCLAVGQSDIAGLGPNATCTPAPSDGCFDRRDCTANANDQGMAIIAAPPRAIPAIADHRLS